MSSDVKQLMNFIGGHWVTSSGDEYQSVIDPGTGDVITQVPLSPGTDVDAAVQAALAAFPDWRRTPATERVQFLFRLKDILEREFEELSRTVTRENGKTLNESRGEMRRAIENVEVACGIPILMQGQFSEDIARGIDEYMIRQPVGVCTIIAPFNFPGMIPFWFWPYAVAAGNTAIIKPSERTPITMQKVMALVKEAGFPEGVVNLVNGGPMTVNALLEHPGISAVSFVGSTPVAKHIYRTAAAHGKRVQAQGGAKNPLIILPDADLETTTRIVTDSVFGNAGQRCLAASLVLTIGDETRKQFGPALKDAASTRIVGYGLDEGVQMGPVITPESRERIKGAINRGLDEGARLFLDGRDVQVPGHERGYFLAPSILDEVPPMGEVFTTEIFGPVMGLMHVQNVDEAIDLVNSGRYGNMACLFTRDGHTARRFRYEAQAGNIGINIGVAAPMAFFPFSGWKESFFGTLHGQGRHAVEFFTQTKIVIERWFEEWSRQF